MIIHGKRGVVFGFFFILFSVLSLIIFPYQVLGATYDSSPTNPRQCSDSVCSPNTVCPYGFERDRAGCKTCMCTPNPKTVKQWTIRAIVDCPAGQILAQDVKFFSSSWSEGQNHPFFYYWDSRDWNKQLSRDVVITNYTPSDTIHFGLESSVEVVKKSYSGSLVKDYQELAPIGSPPHSAITYGQWFNPYSSMAIFNREQLPQGTYTVHFAVPTQYKSQWCINGKPDLTISGNIAVTPTSQVVNGSVNIKFTMINNGNVSTPATYMYSNQAGGTSSIATGNTCTGSTVLAPGGTCVSSYNFTFPTAGSKTMEIFIDSGNTVAESNENNNKFTTTVTVTSSKPVYTPPPKCMQWFDGCNTCTRTTVGADGSCTRQGCATYSTPYCVYECGNTDCSNKMWRVSPPILTQNAEQICATKGWGACAVCNVGYGYSTIHGWKPDTGTWSSTCPGITMASFNPVNMEVCCTQTVTDNLANCSPVQTAPIGGVTVAGIPTLTWSGCKGGVFYRVKVNGGGTAWTSSSLPSGSYTMDSFAFRPGSTYTWNVQACSDSTCARTTAWSADQMFKTPVAENPCTVMRAQGDANCDKVINQADFDIWKGAVQGKAYSNQSYSANFNNDKMVDIIDYEIWRNSFYQ